MTQYEPEFERQLQAEQARFERMMHTGIDPYEVDDRIRREARRQPIYRCPDCGRKTALLLCATCGTITEDA